MNIYCTTIKYYSIMERFPNYIKPLGLGDGQYPKNWLTENSGENISNLNKFYAELTGFFWIWKNKLSQLNNDDLIGNCHYRVLWLNELKNKKTKFTTANLYDNFLKEDNKILKNIDVIQVQPILYSKNLLQDFKDVHNCDALSESLKFLPVTLANNFFDYLKGNILFPHNMFITKKTFFIDYCEIIFPWLEKCLIYCQKKNLCKGYNFRLPAFLAERFTSFWFSRFKNRELLSYARLGKFHLSNKINYFLNTSKIPGTYYQFPTIHKF